MFKLKIINKKSKQQTHGGEFSTVQEYEAWVNSCEAVSAWGTPEHEEQVLVSEAIPEVTALQEVIISPEEVDETGEVIKEAVTEMQEVVIQEAVEAVYETVVTPAEYEILISDCSEEVAQAAINSEALAYLASTDWYILREMDEGTPCPEEIKTARAEARAKVVR